MSRMTASGATSLDGPFTGTAGCQKPVVVDLFQDAADVEQHPPHPHRSMLCRTGPTPPVRADRISGLCDDGEMSIPDPAAETASRLERPNLEEYHSDD